MSRIPRDYAPGILSSARNGFLADVWLGYLDAF
jgi:hypothetical protein